jgi:Putative restriction endonuclease
MMGPLGVRLEAMRTVISDPPPADFEALLERRRRWGADRHDEVWEGVMHMIPAPGQAHWMLDQQLAVRLDAPARAAGLIAGGEFNLGDRDDYRVPDRGLHRPETAGDWCRTAALVVEIVSPGDETWEKLSFYAAHDVDELLIVDSPKRSVTWLGLRDGEYQPIQRSALIKLGAVELAEQLDWP